MFKKSPMPSRRDLLAASAAAGASLLLVRPAFATDETDERAAIRPFSVRIPEEAVRRPAPADRGHALARPGDGRRPVAGRPAREDPGAGPLLGHRLRLAQGRGEAQCPAAVHHRDRRARYPLHPRPLASPERPAADHDAWLAGLRVRAAQDRRSADRPDRARRTRGRRLRPGPAFDAGLRLLRQANRQGLESRPHRARLGGPDEAPRVHPLRRPGWRLGRPCLERDGAPGAGRTARHPHQPAGDGTVGRRDGARRRRACAGGTLREGTRGVRAARHLLQEVHGLRRDDGHTAADDRLRPDGHARGACRLDVRLQQRRARAPARQGRLARRRHAVLADEHRDLGGADLLGNRRPEHCSCGRAEDRRHRAPGGHLGVSRGGLSRPGDMGPARLSQPQSTSTRSTRAATSPRGKSRSSSVPNFAPRSGRCANGRTEIPPTYHGE